ncbi:MAG: dienelactone hydrolase family protein [Reyranellaceae bacterium]
MPADVSIPTNAFAAVIFVHGSGSSRLSPRNRRVAADLNAADLATILFDLLTPEEAADRRNVFDIALLGERVDQAVAFAQSDSRLDRLPIGLFGASTGAAAALVSAARSGADIAAVVSRGGRPDMAGDALPLVRAPTLLIVGGSDEAVLELNQKALRKLRCVKRLEVVPGATHLFEEPGTLDRVVDLATTWFGTHLRGPT